MNPLLMGIFKIDKAIWRIIATMDVLIYSTNVRIDNFSKLFLEVREESKQLLNRP